MHFVTTEETGLAEEYGIKSFPTIALFRNGEPVIYKGLYLMVVVRVGEDV